MGARDRAARPTRVLLPDVQGPARLEMQECEVPKIGHGEALLRVEMCGICGSDVKTLHGDLNKQMGVPFPVIPGHEPVGIVEEIGDETSRRWHVRRGDRVAVEALFRCGFCRNCLLGSYVLCTGA